MLFYLLLVRPQTKRQKEMARMQAALEVGDRVVLTAGIHATVTAVADDTVDVEVAPGVVLTTARQAIGQALSGRDSLPREENPASEETPEPEETPDQPGGSEQPGPDRRGTD